MGVFASTVGDLVIRVLSDVCSVPVVIVSSSADNPVKPIFPEETVISEPLYLALDCSASGHYDTTKALDHEPPSSTRKLYCFYS